jgi:hypothetical protein
MNKQRILQLIFGLITLGVIIWIATLEPKRPGLPKWDFQDKLLEQASKEVAALERQQADAELIRRLLAEKLSDRTFAFPVVIEATSGKHVIPLRGRSSANRVAGAIRKSTNELIVEMNAVDSPIKGLRRINEASRFFEDGLREKLNAVDGIRCSVPENQEGKAQRSGYPDLTIVDEVSGDIYYLDPKVMEQGSLSSSLRTFYFEPKERTLKVTEDASHLLIGIEHDGNDGDWKFLGYRLVDLSKLRVRLKAEFQASNRDLYSERAVLESSFRSGKDISR